MVDVSDNKIDKLIEDEKDPNIKELLEDVKSDIDDREPIDAKVAKDLILEENDNDSINNDSATATATKEDVLFEPSAVLNTNSTSFPLELKQALQTILDEVKKGRKLSEIQEYLTYYQLLTYNYFNWMTRSKIKTDINGNNYVPKGLLISYVMGAGKTAIAVSCCLAALKIKDKPARIIVMLLKSLQENFVKNIRTVLKHTGMIDTDIEVFINKHFKFVAFNASNMVKQLWQAASNYEERMTEINLGELLVNSGTLENSLIVVDEYHLLGRAITNGSKNGHSFYNAVMRTPSVRLLFLTGSIISNDPFELSVCFNLLSGQELFPTDYFEFKRLFCEDKGRLQKDIRGKFQNRILGLTSYISLEDMAQFKKENTKENKSKKDKEENFTPVLREDKIIKVKMTDYQSGLYVAARRKESEEINYSVGPVIPALTKPKSAMIGTYKQKSRQLSNYAPPNNPTEKITGANSQSPKYKAILENLKLPGTHIIYSQYTGIGGLGSLRVYLRANGFESWQSATDITEFSNKKSNNPPSEEAKLSKVADLIDENRADDREGEQKTDEIAEEILVKEDEDIVKEPNILKVKINDIQEESIAMPPVEEIKTDNKLRESVKDFLAEGSGNNTLRYALFTGDEDAETRTAALKDFNSVKNLDGSVIKVLMISLAGALGVDTNNCRYVHLLEPYWVMSIMNQVQARALRLNSHRDLPQDQRFVQTFIYFAYPQKMPDVPEELLGSTDEEIYTHAKEGFDAITSWLEPIRETSIECPILEGRQCRVCAPTDRPLFTKDLIRDLRSTDSCTPYQESEIETKQIIVDHLGKPVDLFYKEENGKVEGYVFDLGLNAHRRLRHGEELYKILISSIESKISTDKNV